MPTSKAFTSVVALAGVGFAALSGGCTPEEAIEQVEQKVSYAYKDLYVGKGINRKQRARCDRRCVRTEDRGPRGKQGHEWEECVEWVDDCSLPYHANGLFADDWARDHNVHFEAYNDGRPYYAGCGRHAIQNVLAWYGIYFNMSNDIVGRTNVIDFAPFSGNIASLPDDLANDLGNILHWFGDGNFVVQRRSGVHVPSVIRSEIDKGNPVIVLVNGGGHWVTAVGYDGPDVFLIDYAWSATERRNIHQLDTDFIKRWSGGYTSDTVITIQRL